MLAAGPADGAGRPELLLSCGGAGTEGEAPPLTTSPPRPGRCPAASSAGGGGVALETAPCPPPGQLAAASARGRVSLGLASPA